MGRRRERKTLDINWTKTNLTQEELEIVTDAIIDIWCEAIVKKQNNFNSSVDIESAICYNANPNKKEEL